MINFKDNKHFELYYFLNSDARSNVEDLFDSANMVFAVEISLAAGKDTSSIQIKNEQDLYRALTNRVMLDLVLKQGLDYILSDIESFDNTSKFEKLQQDNWSKIVDYFMSIKDGAKLEELRIY